MKPKVLLYEHVGLALIVAFPSGVIYSNQAGGSSCLQPEIEGVLIPLRNDCLVEDKRLLSPAIALEEYFLGEKWGGTGATRGIDGEDADSIDAIFQIHRLSRCIEVARTCLHESCEAWIHVVVNADENTDIPLFSGVGPYQRPGVLTWPNSD